MKLFLRILLAIVATPIIIVLAVIIGGVLGIINAIQFTADPIDHLLFPNKI